MQRAVSESGCQNRLAGDPHERDISHRTTPLGPCFRESARYGLHRPGRLELFKPIISVSDS